MLQLFNTPMSSHVHQTALLTLNQLIAWVSQSPLPESTKQDSIKILETMRWIKINLEELREFVDNKEKYLPQLPMQDKDHGVVRDHLGTSVHFNSYHWCHVIRLSADPKTTPSATLKRILQHQPAYALFDDMLYFINSDASLRLLSFDLKHIAQLASIFPTVNNVPQEGSKASSEIITSLTSHGVQTPGERAVHDLSEIIITFERIFQILRETNNTLALLSFIAKCEYDKDRGCLEARVEKAMLFAGQIAATHGSCLQLEDLLQLCQMLYFFELDNDLPNFIMASEFFIPFYGQKVFYLGKEQRLSEDIVFTAMEDLLSYKRPSSTDLKSEITLKASNLQQWQAQWNAEELAHQATIFQQLIKNSNMVIGHGGMIQYRFKKKEQADQLSQWLRACKSLAVYEINRCQTKEDQRGIETEYVVRLTQLQRDRLTSQTRVSPAEPINQALVIKNSYNDTALSLAAFKQDSVAFQALIHKTSVEAINQALVIKRLFFNDNPLSLVAYYQNSAAFQVLIHKASVEAINQALVIKNSYNDTPLSLAAEKQNSTAFQALIDKASVEAINQALVIKNNNNNTPLIVAAYYQGSVAFQALIHKASVEAIGEALVIKNSYYNLTPLMSAAFKQDSVAFQALIHKSSVKAINQALVIKESHNDTALSLAAFKQDSVAFQALIHKSSVEAINQALVIKNSHNDTALNRAAYYQDSVAFQALIHKASTAAINQALVIKNNNNNTPLSWAAFKQDSAAFQALIHKASVEAINQALVIKNSHNETALSLAAFKQDSVAFQALIHKSSVEAINQALVIKNSHNDTALSWAAEKQDSIAFQALIHKSSVEAINQALIIKNNEGYGPLHELLKKQNLTAVRALLDKMSPKIIQQSLIIMNVEKTLAWVEAELSVVNHRAELESWIVLFLKISGKLDSWPSGKLLTDEETLLSEIGEITDGPIFDLINRIMYRWFSLPPIIPNSPDLTSTSRVIQATTALIPAPISLTLGDDTTAQLTDDNLADVVQTHGLASWKEFYILTKHCAAHPNSCALRNTLDLMERYDTLQPSLLKESIRDFNQELQDGHVLMKTFSGWQPHAWTNFIKQLKNPTQRVSLRKKIEPTQDSSYKLHHLTGEITPYSKGQKVKPHHQTHAKKQSTTLISPEKCTPLFQSHQPGALLVGVALRADPTMEPGRYELTRAKIKAMLGADTGTYQRKWRGSLEEVKTYAQKTKNYTSLDAFKKAIRHNTREYNEVLAEPSKESLMGIVIGRDTPDARQLARQYQQDIQRHLGIKLPIVLYNATIKNLIEDLDLHEGISRRYQLIAQKERLLNTEPVTLRSFFTRYKTYEGKQYLADIVSQLNTIDKQLEDLHWARSPTSCDKQSSMFKSSR